MAIRIASSWTEELILAAVRKIFKIDEDLPTHSITTSVTDFKPFYCFTPQTEAKHYFSLA